MSDAFSDASKSEHYRVLEQRLNALISDSEYFATSTTIDEVRDFIKNGEYGVALVWLAHSIDEAGTLVSAELANKNCSLADFMDIADELPLQLRSFTAPETREGSTKWQPVFPEPQPAHWVSFAQGSDKDVVVSSDEKLSSSQRDWLARWLGAHENRHAAEEASYVYLGLGSSYLDSVPDGRTSSAGVTGIGSGEGFAQPPGARLSTVATITARAHNALGQV